MANKVIRLATVFSGVGAIEHAFLKLNVPYEIVFACDNGERELTNSYEQIIETCQKNCFDDIKTNNYVKSLYEKTGKNNWMKTSYFANYNISEDRWYEDIRFINGKKFHDKVDLFVGGSPCQSFSIIGKRGGLEDARGTLFYEYARLIKEIQPKVFIYENVVGMLTHDKGNTWRTIKSIFESLDYNISFTILNAKDFGIPQDRRRLFVVGSKKPSKKFDFPKPVKLECTLFDYLEKNVNTKHYLGKKGFEFVTNPKYKNRARVNRDIIQTEKANQQFNWNGDFVFEKLDKKKHNEEILNRAFVGKWNGKTGVIRQLSYRECYRLMGFSDSFKIVTPNVWAYRQAGNSIVVNIFEKIIIKLIEEERL